MIYPWQQALWDACDQRWQQQRLPHALLLHGSAGMGKQHFSESLAAALLCETPQTQLQACGQCPACLLLQAGTHPDFYRYQPEATGKAIKIAQIRQLIEKALFTPRRGRYQIMLVSPAEAMNSNAANALLKILEEPPAQTLLLLLSQQAQQLPITLRSRCQGLDFDRCDEAQKKHWLQSQINDNTIDVDTLLHQSPAPLQALAQLAQQTQRQQVLLELSATLSGQRDIVTTAIAWLALDMPQLLHWLTHWVMDLIRYRSSDVMPASFDAIKPLLQWSVAVNPAQLFDLLDCILAQQQHFNRNQLKPQTCLEAILLTWLQLKQE